MLNSRALNNRINNIHQRALTLTYKDNQSSFKGLLEKDHYLTDHHKKLQVLQIFKVKSVLVPNIMKDVFELKYLHATYDQNQIILHAEMLRLLITVSYQLSTYNQLHNILRLFNVL